ncbi:biotin--[acetyl-CoA-carboxylase] ligase [Capsulimonas corticalis]|uniref:Biotin--[acetyl-CoA-carboxylase] ligase n=1 Tax=Capsulimonas corticalis TaxID=2219043 RepID=A0A402CXV7_9BACT|nr:biotin--[acetyl-CoA-carboxylase] ligase [Capsulimonas corticalis]BDI32146.1 biotin--[acetyl-CoA-carboxylase] ligase [Capsulimonas corticalis]
MTIGSQWRHYAECGSTSDLARSWALDPEAPAPDGAVVTADLQTQGRGRRGASWRAAGGENLLMTVVLHPPYPVSAAWRLGYVAALAVADALAELGLSPQLKWPNDVLLAGNKTCGVLVETALLPNGEWRAILGIGVNVNQTEFPDAETFVYPPTSLRMASGRTFAMDEVRQRLWEWLERWEDIHRSAGDFDPIAAGWRRYLAVGAKVRRGGETAELQDIESDGAARVCLHDGTFTVWRTVDG